MIGFISCSTLLFTSSSSTLLFILLVIYFVEFKTIIYFVEFNTIIYFVKFNTIIYFVGFSKVLSWFFTSSTQYFNTVLQHEYYLFQWWLFIVLCIFDWWDFMFLGLIGDANFWLEGLIFLTGGTLCSLDWLVILFWLVGSDIFDRGLYVPQTDWWC